MKPYYCLIEKSDISYPETRNDLKDNSADNTSYQEIFTPPDNLRRQKLCQRGRLQVSHLTNDLMDEMMDIFMSHKDCADYKLAL